MAGVAIVAAVFLLRSARLERPSDRIASLDARAAGDSADRWMRSGRFLAAIPYLEQVGRVTPRTTANYEGAFATALRNAALEVHERGGVALPATRSSIERIALVRESLARLDAGERKADDPAVHGRLIAARAEQLVTWGFPLEGYQEYWRAHDAHLLDEAARLDAARLEFLLRRPVPAEGPPGDAAGPGAAGDPAGRIDPSPASGSER
jgi:hypothetical protein